MNFGQPPGQYLGIDEATPVSRIWIVQIGEPLLIRGDERKMRSNILAEELAKRGHDITLWVSAFDHNAKDWAISSAEELAKRERIRVLVLKGTGYRRNISPSRYFDHRLLSWKFRRLSKKQDRPDVVIASLPPHDLAYQSVKYAKKNNIPVVVDIRDPWPEVFLDSFPESLKGLARILLFWEFRILRKIMKKADYLVAVSNAFLRWGQSYGNRVNPEKDRVYYLGYHRPFSADRKENVGNELKRTLEFVTAGTVVTYIGTFSGFQDPTIIIRGAERLIDDDIAFVFTGNGNLYDRTKEKLRSKHNVHFVGWLNGDEIDALLAISSIGICPYSKPSDIFPNKAFMYMSMGIPVVSSYQGDLKALIESEKIGFTFDPGDVDALVEAILTLHGNRRIYGEMSENVRRLFESRFDAENIYKDFADHIESIARESGS